jgi:hypothetical protein
MSFSRKVFIVKIVKNSMAKPFAVVLVLSLAFAALGMSQAAFVQKRVTGSATGQVSGLLSSLPPSDAVALINVKRVLDEALPKLLAENPTQLAEVTTELANFKTQTGLDPRSFDQIALGLRYTYPSEGTTQIKTIALARGTFNSGAIVAAGRLAADGKYLEQKFQGKTIYVFQLERQVRLLGLWDLKVGELAVSALDGHTLALGNLTSVKEVIESNRTGTRPNPDLIAMATRDPNAVVGFGGNISEALLQNLRISNDGIARELAAVRQVYGTLGLTSTDLELMLAARTVDTYAARNLGDTVEGLKQFGGLFINRLSAARGTVARSALNNLKITTQGNELQIRTAVAQAQVAPLMR